MKSFVLDASIMCDRHPLRGVSFFLIENGIFNISLPSPSKQGFRVLGLVHDVVLMELVSHVCSWIGGGVCV